MYDMYPWNDPDSGADNHQDEFVAAWLPAPRDGHSHADSLVRAVQVALDRRDNGGDAVTMAGSPATRPTVCRTRQ